MSVNEPNFDHVCVKKLGKKFGTHALPNNAKEMVGRNTSAERTPVVTVRLSSIIFMDVLPYSMMQLRIRNMQWKVELNCMRTDN